MWPIIDANINRVCEGLRVIEEYARFIAGNLSYTRRIADLRHGISKASFFSEIKKDFISNESLNQNSEKAYTACLNSRNTYKDVRAKEPPPKRDDLRDLLIANFKRVCEGLRVLEEYTSHSIFNEYRYTVYDLEKDMMLHLFKKKISKGIYLISDQVSVLKQGLEWGVALIQLRDKVCSKADYLEKAKAVKNLQKGYETPFIVNDYLDIALLVDADGFHSGQDDLPVSKQRALLGPHRLIGKTTHHLTQGLEAEAEGADYVSVGPIWDTPSKPGRAGIGFDYLKEALCLKIPYVAIGGICLENIGDVLAFSPPLIGVIRDYKNIPNYPIQYQNRNY